MNKIVHLSLWITTKDYHQLKRYSKSGLLETQGITKSQMLATIIISKVFYYGVFMVLPLIFADVAWYITVLGFCTMHVIAGLTLASIFQPAHVVPSSTFPVPDPSGNIDADWAVSQLMNTANFAGKARMFSWYVGWQQNPLWQRVARGAGRLRFEARGGQLFAAAGGCRCRRACGRNPCMHLLQHGHG